MARAAKKPMNPGVSTHVLHLANGYAESAWLCGFWLYCWGNTRSHTCPESPRIAPKHPATGANWRELARTHRPRETVVGALYHVPRRPLIRPSPSTRFLRSEERRVGKECR